MKDYRLSEIKAHCKKVSEKYGKTYCTPCGKLDEDIYNCCLNKIICTVPESWDIEPRDMIELPCKEHRVNLYGDVWDVYYRDERYGFIRHECRGTEAEADAFIAQLKKDK